MMSCNSTDRFTCSSYSCNVTWTRLRNDLFMDLPMAFLMSNDTIRDTRLEICVCNCFGNGHPPMILLISETLGCLFGKFCLCFFCLRTKNVDF